jgi:hypothetical protein
MAKWKHNLELREAKADNRARNQATLEWIIISRIDIFKEFSWGRSTIGILYALF